MPCIHCIDETNCPICRITESTIPIKYPNLKEVHNNDLKPNNPHLEHLFSENKNLQNELISKNDVNLNPRLINLIPKPNVINEIPSFKNQLFLERLREIDISKSDVFGISKKIGLLSSELKVKKKKE
jgi:hypothetical protein